MLIRIAMPTSCDFSALLFSTLILGVLGTDPYYSANYIRRTGHAIAVIDKTLYIDGGEISQYINGSIDNSRASRQVNDTLSIPLDVSWTNKSAVITPIAKAAPAFDREALWTDESAKSMFMWGGQGPWGNLSKTRDLWKFEPAGGATEGGWTKQLAANVDVFLTVVRSVEAASTTCNGAGFYIGGFGTIWTDTAFAVGNTGVPVPGMLTYNMTTGHWANESTAGLNNVQTLISGSAACLPSFGSVGQGIVMVLGGEVAPRTSYNASAPNVVGLDNVTFWDIGSKMWYSQETTGDIPTPRSRFCVVSAVGANGSHEIFVFGGHDAATNTGFEDIYVLTIPGFVWFKADISTGGPRTSHQCVLAGNRQMIIVGGSNPTKSFTGAFQDPDPWTNGIGIIDVSTLSWKDEFDPSAQAYASPEKVTNWYNAGNQDKVSWTSDTVKNLFITESGPKNGTSSNGGTSPASSPTPIGAIIGGVIGGVAVLSLAGLIVFFILRRKKQHRSNMANPAGSSNAPEYYLYDPPLVNVHEMFDQSESKSPAMLPTDERPGELHTWNYQDESGEESLRHQQSGLRSAYEME